MDEVLGGTPQQSKMGPKSVWNIIWFLTCDPVGGLDQVPKIERNAMGSVKEINATPIALRGNGAHFVPLDKVIKTMRETAADMKTKYKETSCSGLAINLTEC
jgi:L-serine dehydratase